MQGSAKPGLAIRVGAAPPEFTDWEILREVLARNFAYMEGRISPPSSLIGMSAADLETRSREETLLLAMAGEQIAGCAYLRFDHASVYIGKLAIDGPFRSFGLARRIMEVADVMAREAGKSRLVLQTRVELVENHEAFARLGFSIAAYTAHEGFERPTSVTMVRSVRSGWPLMPGANPSNLK
jgi:N-acetylglutamate synthase-like GNAT family acetyltransferase